MKKFHRIIPIIISFLIIIPLNVLAADSASVGGNDIIAADSYQTVPIYLTNNPGVMGFKISVEYPDSVEIKSISRGTICSGGMFETNLENHKGNIIDVVWSSTENVADDGSVFIISLKAPESAAGKEIKISYSKDDTFNETWEDVALFCTGLNIVLEEGQAKDSVISNESISDKDYDYIKSVIDTELSNYNADSIEKISDKDKDGFVESVSKQLTGITVNGLSDIETLYKASVKNEFISGVNVSVDSETIETIIEDSLNSSGAKSIDELSDNNSKSFNDSVINKIKDIYPEYSKDFDNLDEKDKTDAIKTLYNKTMETVENTSGSGIKPIVYIIISVVAVAMLILIILKIVRNKKKAGDKNEKSTIDSSCDSDSDN